MTVPIAGICLGASGGSEAGADRLSIPIVAVCPETFSRSSAARHTLKGMCRNIRQLHNFEPPATSDEVRAAALQYVRKVSGTTKPSQANQEAFDEAVEAVAQATQHLLAHLTTSAPPKDRETERAKARARNAVRFGTPA
jgi:hypothetical protein